MTERFSDEGRPTPEEIEEEIRVGYLACWAVSLLGAAAAIVLGAWLAGC